MGESSDETGLIKNTKERNGNHQTLKKNNDSNSFLFDMYLDL
jgi:hypothetical protein